MMLFLLSIEVTLQGNSTVPVLIKKY